MTSFKSDSPGERLVGVWESEEKNLHIEMFEEDGYFAGRTIWFRCSEGDSVVCTHRDVENPDPQLTSRPLLGMKVVEHITYQGNDTWGNGRIYDPNSGHTYDAEIRLIGPNTVVVRGYWNFKWFGRSMVFNRLESDVYATKIQSREGN